MLKQVQIIAIVIFVCALSTAALAEPKANYFVWHHDHWDESLFHPYADDGRVMHNEQWAIDDKNWHPQDWINPHGGAEKAMEAFYDKGLIVEMRVKKGVPQLVVGDSYKDLSPRDRQRLAITVDYIFGVTSKDPYVFRVIDKRSGKTLGLYTRLGLQAH